MDADRTPPRPRGAVALAFGTLLAALGLAGIAPPAAAQAPSAAAAAAQDPAPRRRPEPQRPTICHNYGSSAEITGTLALLPGGGPGSNPRTRRVAVVRVETPFCMRVVIGEAGMALPQVVNVQLVLEPEDWVRWQRLLTLPRVRAAGKLVARKDPVQQTLVVLEVREMAEPPRQ